MEVDDHKIQLHDKIYHVKTWEPSTITAQILCQHISQGHAPKQRDRVNEEDEDTPILSIPFKVEWDSARITETDIILAHNGKQTIETYTLNTAPKQKKTRKHPPTPPHQPGGWQPQPTTFTTQPINPDLDTIATGSHEIT
jgi:hypothetical protein